MEGYLSRKAVESALLETSKKRLEKCLEKWYSIIHCDQVGSISSGLWRNFSQWGCWGAGIGCPEKVWLHHWKCSKLGSTGLWAIWLNERCPCSWEGVGLDGLWGSLPTQNILWFYGITVVTWSLHTKDWNLMVSRCLSTRLTYLNFFIKELNRIKSSAREALI